MTEPSRRKDDNTIAQLIRLWPIALSLIITASSIGGRWIKIDAVIPQVQKNAEAIIDLQKAMIRIQGPIEKIGKMSDKIIEIEIIVRSLVRK